MCAVEGSQFRQVREGSKPATDSCPCGKDNGLEEGVVRWRESTSCLGHSDLWVDGGPFVETGSAAGRTGRMVVVGTQFCMGYRSALLK